MEGKTGLAPYKDQKIKIVGRYTKFDIWRDYRTHREYPRCCLLYPENGNRVVADHVWVDRTEKIKEGCPNSTGVSFIAIVREYTKDGRLKDYFLDYPEEITFFPDRQAVALRIPGPPSEELEVGEEAMTSPVNAHSTAEPTVTGLPTGIPLGMIFKVKECAKELGGWDRLEALGRC